MRTEPPSDFLDAFLEESDAIAAEPTTLHEREVAEKFLKLKMVSVADVRNLAFAITPKAQLRMGADKNASEGLHRVPHSIVDIEGPQDVEGLIRQILGRINTFTIKTRKQPHQAKNLALNIHAEFENLHPFMDGNGRVGRLLWLYVMQMTRGSYDFVKMYGFLQSWYYQSLEGKRGGWI